MCLCSILPSDASENKIVLFITWQKFLRENLPARFKSVYTKFCFIIRLSVSSLYKLRIRVNILQMLQ